MGAFKMINIFSDDNNSIFGQNAIYINGKDMYQKKLAEQKTMNKLNNNLNSGYFDFLLFVTVKLVWLLLHDLHDLNDINSFIPGRKKGDLKNQLFIFDGAEIKIEKEFCTVSNFYCWSARAIKITVSSWGRNVSTIRIEWT